MKIIDKIRRYREEGKPFFSFEYFPPKTDAGLHNLYARLDRMAVLEPAFIDITWGAGGTTQGTTLEIAKNAQTYFGLDVMMHLTCTNMSKNSLLEVLNTCKKSGIKNILALRGDPPSQHGDWKAIDGGLSYASELVTFIRENFGDFFSIGVAAYPEAHLESENLDQDIKFLKEKQNCGADFAVTQLFYDLNLYQSFLKKASEAGITLPIIPGILPIQNYQRFIKFTSSLGVKVPEDILNDLKAIQSDDSKIQEYGINLGTKMSRQLVEMGAEGLHFYTLNLESSVTSILEKLGYTEDSRTRRSLPWRKSLQDDRQDEEVRPIFWANRPKSYLARTTSWDDYPNGRWGDTRSPTFGALDEYYLMRRGLSSKTIQEKRLKMWGTPQTTDDISQVFAKYCQGKINELPWCDEPVLAETGLISEKLVKLNRSGFWTINSQPKANAVDSCDPELGWGGEGGYVFQKEYVEFFTTKDQLHTLMDKIKNFPQITYQAVAASGNFMSNADSINAVTWGVFPGKEIIQPTIVDPESFLIWKDEAFGLWNTEWATLYKPDSDSHKLLNMIKENYYLVNLVDNNFVDGDLFAIFE